MCRQAGFFEHATYLAERYGRHEEYLRIQIEDAEEYVDALRYLRSLGPVAVSAKPSGGFSTDLRDVVPGKYGTVREETA